eukprot:8070415-Pyramimonas_sp.AAC.1
MPKLLDALSNWQDNIQKFLEDPEKSVKDQTLKSSLSGVKKFTKLKPPPGCQVDPIEVLTEFHGNCQKFRVLLTNANKNKADESEAIISTLHTMHSQMRILMGIKGFCENTLMKVQGIIVDKVCDAWAKGNHMPAMQAW